MKKTIKNLGNKASIVRNYLNKHHAGWEKTGDTGCKKTVLWRKIQRQKGCEDIAYADVYSVFNTAKKLRSDKPEKVQHNKSASPCCGSVISPKQQMPQHTKSALMAIRANLAQFDTIESLQHIQAAMFERGLDIMAREGLAA
jgi:hypothetical protein